MARSVLDWVLVLVDEESGWEKLRPSSTAHFIASDARAEADRGS